MALLSFWSSKPSKTGADTAETKANAAADKSALGGAGAAEPKAEPAPVGDGSQPEPALNGDDAPSTTPAPAQSDIPAAEDDAAAASAPEEDVNGVIDQSALSIPPPATPPPSSTDVQALQESLAVSEHPSPVAPPPATMPSDAEQSAPAEDAVTPSPPTATVHVDAEPTSDPIPLQPDVPVSDATSTPHEVPNSEDVAAEIAPVEEANSEAPGVIEEADATERAEAVLEKPQSDMPVTTDTEEQPGIPAETAESAPESVSRLDTTPKDVPAGPSSTTSPLPPQSDVPVTTETEEQPSIPAEAPASAPESVPQPDTTPKDVPAGPSSTTSPLPRRFSMRTFTAWASRSSGEHARRAKPALSHIAEQEAKHRAAEASVRARVRTSGADRKAHESALIVRSLIVGPTIAPPRQTHTQASTARPQLSKVKSQLMEPKTANKVIAQLRAMPMAEIPVTQDGNDVKVGTAVKGHGPIHAVCLPYTDTEAQKDHFVRLKDGKDVTEGDGNRQNGSNILAEIPSIATASLHAVTDVLKDMQLVDLLTAPNLGLGAPGNAPGLFAGAIPTAETVIKGATQITPQLMDFGYTMGKAIWADHEGVYPPTDRMSVLTYWWGLEVVLPPPSIDNLAHVPSVSHALINFLTAMSVANTGVREILPFVRYISQYIDFEFNVIQKMNQGQGVVCAATWIMPAALVPRPWDFPEPPPTPAPAPAPAPADESVPAAAQDPVTPPGLNSAPTAPAEDSPVDQLLGAAAVEQPSLNSDAPVSDSSITPAALASIPENTDSKDVGATTAPTS